MSNNQILIWHIKQMYIYIYNGEFGILTDSININVLKCVSVCLIFYYC